MSVNSVSSVEQKNQVNTKINKTSKSNGTSFDSYLGESSSMDKIFDKAAAKYNVPVELLKAIGKTESNFNANAVSQCGARGVMQLMPATARGLGVNNSFDPEQNIMGGAKYISGLLKKYNGDTKLALAAYNAGSGNVAKYNGIPPFKETQNYVKKVLGFMAQGGNDSGVNNSNSTSSNVTSTNNSTNTHDSSATTNNTKDVDSSNALSVNDDTTNSLDEIFTYDDYLRFINQFLEDEKKNEKEDNNSNYASKQINYSVPVMNLLKSTHL